MSRKGECEPRSGDVGSEGKEADTSGSSRAILVGFGRAFGGALIFALPMLMTMEMWWLGFYADRLRLALLLILNVPLLIMLSRLAGFEETKRWTDDVRDAAIAYGIGVFASAVILVVFGILKVGMPLDEVIGKIAMQAVPASIGAVLGRTQLGSEEAEPPDRPEEAAYVGDLFLMGVGALFLGLNVAPTEEMVLIAYKMTGWHALALIILSVGLMHGFVYAAGFQGGQLFATSEMPWWSPFLRLTLAGYVLAIAISLYVLWTFGRTDGASSSQIMMAVIVLGFPASIGAAAARLIL